MNRPEVRALKPTELVMALNKVPGWTLSGDGDNIAIEKTFEFAQHTHALLFVNGRRCVVRWRTHSVRGLSALDFEAATQTDALLSA